MGEENTRNSKMCKIVAISVIATIMLIFGIVIVLNRIRYNEYLNEVNNYNAGVEEYNDYNNQYLEKVKQISENTEELMNEITLSQEVILKGGRAYDENCRESLEKLLIEYSDGIVIPPTYNSEEALTPNKKLFKFSEIKKEKEQVLIKQKELSSKQNELVTALNGLDIVSYSDEIGKLESARKELMYSCALERQITNPEKEFVIERLKSVPEITNIAPSTIGNDPNNGMSADNGYTVQIFFATNNLDTADLKGDALINEGTKAGGSIEVYRNCFDAEQRMEYFHHTEKLDEPKIIAELLGSTIIRASGKLSDDKAESLRSSIQEALLKCDDTIYEDYEETKYEYPGPIKLQASTEHVNYIFPFIFEKTYPNFSKNTIFAVIGDVSEKNVTEDSVFFIATTVKYSQNDPVWVMRSSPEAVAKEIMSGFVENIRDLKELKGTFLGQEVSIWSGNGTFDGEDVGVSYAGYFNPYTYELEYSIMIYKYGDVSNYSYPDVHKKILENASVNEIDVSTITDELFSGKVEAETKETLDQAEAFITDYVAFLNQYNKSETKERQYDKYHQYISEYSETMKKLGSMSNNKMDTATINYYYEVLNRIAEKIFSVEF